MSLLIIGEGRRQKWTRQKESLKMKEDNKLEKKKKKNKMEHNERICKDNQINVMKKLNLTASIVRSIWKIWCLSKSKV